MNAPVIKCSMALKVSIFVVVVVGAKINQSRRVYGLSISFD